MVSPQLSHIQHYPTSMYPFLTSLSHVRIFPLATVQTKKETLLGALTPQILLQGKLLAQAPLMRHRKNAYQNLPSLSIAMSIDLYILDEGYRIKGD